jgi:hypothetical protein
VVATSAAHFTTAPPHRFFVGPDELRDARVREALALDAAHDVGIEPGQAMLADVVFDVDEIGDLDEEPGINAGDTRHILEGIAVAQRIGHVEDALGARDAQLLAKVVAIEVGCDRAADLVEPGDARFQATQRFLQRLLEVAPHRHDFADRFHLRGQAVVGTREFLEREARDLGHDVIDRRLERGRRQAARDVVLELVERIANRKLGGDLCDREARGLGSQRRRARHARVHFDDQDAARIRADRELHVGTARFNSDLAQHIDRGVTQPLVFLVGQGLRRSDRDGVTRVHAHRIKILD